jgi:uncharacterized delta-60 repeat protein
MFRNFRRALLGLVVTASSIVVVPLTASVASASSGAIDGSTWSPASGGFAKFQMTFTENSTSVTFKAKSAVETSSGGLLVAGHVGDIGTYATEFALVRITSAGVVDTAFDGNGLKILDNGADYGAADFIQGSGSNYFVGGWSGTSTLRRAAVVKVNESGEIDSQWGASGWAETSSSYTRYEGARTGKEGEKAFFIDGTQIVMWSENVSMASQLVIHRFSVSTGQLMVAGGPISNPVSIDKTIFATGVLEDDPETFVMLSNTTMLIATRTGSAYDTSNLYKIDLGVTPAAPITSYGVQGILPTLVQSYHLEDFRFGKNNSYNTRIFLAGSSPSPDSYVVRLNTDGTVDTASFGPNQWGNMTNHPGYLEILTFNLASGDFEFLADGEMLISGAGPGFNYQLRKYNTTTDGSSNSLFGNGGQAGVVSIAPACNVIQSGWLIPISGGSNFFLMGPKTYTVNTTSVNGFGALKFVGSGNAATACDGLPAPIQVSYGQASYSGTAMQQLSIPAPNISGNLGSVLFTVNNVFQSLPSGLTIDSSTGQISGSPASSTGGSIMIGITATYAAPGVTQTGNTTITLDITAASNGGGGGSGGGGSGGGPGGMPTCTAGAPNIVGTAPGVDASFGSNGWLRIAPQGATAFSAAGIVRTSDNKTLLVSKIVSGGTPRVDIRKFDDAGVAVSGFGSNGVLTVDPSTNTETAIYLNSVASDPSGGIAILGYYNTSSSTFTRFVIKLTSAGLIDTTFNSTGVLEPGSSVIIPRISIGSDGSVYYAGSSLSGAGTTYWVKRITATGTLDNSFGSGGSITDSTTLLAPAFNSDGTFFLGTTSNGQIKVAKYQANGSLVSGWATQGEKTFGDPAVAETIASMAVVGQSLMVLYSAAGQIVNTYPTSTWRIAKIDLSDNSGNFVSAFGSGGIAIGPVYAGLPQKIRVMSNGDVIVQGLYYSNLGPLAAAARFSNAGVIDPAFATNAAQFMYGTCTQSYGFSATDQGGLVEGPNGKVYLAAIEYPLSTGGPVDPTAVNLALLNFSAQNSGGGSSGGVTAPTLVTSTNQSQLERDPGEQGMVVNGQSVSIDTTRVEISAARTPAAQRTPAQVAAIQAAGQALLQSFLASLPAGAVTNVTVVNTTTGAVMQNLVFDGNGNSVDVPVEDIVILDGPALSLMIGSDNANITADGKYQVGAGGIIGVVGSGLGASAPGEIVAMSTPTLLANFTTSATGDLSKSAQLPNSIGVGDHTLVVATGNTFAVMGLRVVPAALPTTGLTESGGRTMVIALFTMVFAAVLVRSRRLAVLTR